MNLEEVEIEHQEGHQVITIPENLKIDDNKVYMKKIGNMLYIIPYHRPWEGMINSLKEFTSDFMDQRPDEEFEGREPFK